MKCLSRFTKLMFSKDFRQKEDLRIKQLLIVTLSTIGLIWLVFTEFGRQVINVLAIGLCGILIVYCLIFLILHIMMIFRKYKELKKKWKIEEIMNEEPQEGISTETLSRIPHYFLDLSALIHYSGRFYAGFLTERFKPSWITDEESAVFVTDEQIIEQLQKMEKDAQNNEIYMGYTAYIKRNFKILPNMNSTLFAEYFNLAKEVSNVTFVTRDDRYGDLMEMEGANVKWIS